MTLENAIIKGNEEIAFWLREAREAGTELEVMIGIELMHRMCPKCKDNRWDSFHKVFEHFKIEHYSDVYKERRAREEIRRRVNQYINEHWTIEYESKEFKAAIERRINNPTREEIQCVIKELVLVPEPTRADNMAYAMLTQCVVYETALANNTKFNMDRRALVLYKFNKEYQLPVELIGAIFNIGTSRVRNGLYRGLLIAHGNKEENLPGWMKKVLNM